MIFSQMARASQPQIYETSRKTEPSETTQARKLGLALCRLCRVFRRLNLWSFSLPVQTRSHSVIALGIEVEQRFPSRTPSHAARF